MLPSTAPLEPPPAPDVPGAKRKGRLLTRAGSRLPNANLAPDNCPDPEKAYWAASLRCVGKSIRNTADAVGVSPGTIRRWEKSDWWPAVRTEAVRTEHGELRALALGAAKKALEEGDTVTARWVLERMEPEVFGPPKLQAELTGKGGKDLIPESKPLGMTEAAEVARLLKELDAFAHVPDELTDE